MIELSGTYTFNAPRDAVWDALMDPQVMAGALPGCESLEMIGPNDYRAAIKIKIGPVQGKFEGTVTLSELEPPHRYHLTLSGKGAPGFVKGEGDLVLDEQTDDQTLLTYQGQASVGGKLASVGQRLLDSSAKFIMQQGLSALDKQVHAHIAAKRGGGGGGAGFG